MIVSLVSNIAIWGLYHSVMSIYNAGPDVNTAPLEQKLQFSFLIVAFALVVGLPLSVVELRAGSRVGGVLGIVLSLCTLPLAYVLRACFALATA